MPVLAALDECFSALTKISIYTDLGLEDPAMQHAALLLIQHCGNEIEQTIREILCSLSD